jgi:hypothetical protein
VNGDPETSYSVTGGGLLRRFEAALSRRLRRHPATGVVEGRGGWFYLAVAYAVLAYGSGILWALGVRVLHGRFPENLAMPDLHARALIIVPLLLAAEPIVEKRAVAAGRYLREARIIADEKVDDFKAAIARVARVRDSVAMEVVFLVCCLASAVDKGFSFGTAFSPGAVVSVGLFRFLLVRWLWRWTLWGAFMLEVARLRPVVTASHPDRMGGLGFLMEPSRAFSVVIAAGAASISATWLSTPHVTPSDLLAHQAPAALYAVLAVTLALAPMQVLTPVIYRLRQRGLRAYSALAARHGQAFERRWLTTPGEQALGSPDMSSLADLGTGVDVVRRMSLFIWSKLLVIELVAAALLPMVPVALKAIGFRELLKRVMNALM